MHLTILHSRKNMQRGALLTYFCRFCCYIFPEVDVDAVLMLQVPNQTLQNVTMHGHFNHSGLHMETHLNFTLLGCCTRPQRNCTHPDKAKTPPTPSPASHQTLTGKTNSSSPLCQSNRNECIFHYSGSNVLNTYTKGETCNIRLFFYICSLIAMYGLKNKNEMTKKEIKMFFGDLSPVKPFLEHPEQILLLAHGTKGTVPRTLKLPSHRSGHNKCMPSETGRLVLGIFPLKVLSELQKIQCWAEIADCGSRQDPRHSIPIQPSLFSLPRSLHPSP